MATVNTKAEEVDIQMLLGDLDSVLLRINISFLALILLNLSSI
jgi:hypothetical protein